MAGPRPTSPHRARSRATAARRLAAVAAALLLTTLALHPPATAAAPTKAAAKEAEQPFGMAAFDEIVELVRKSHLQPLLDTPRPWVAAANGALSALPVATSLMEQAMLRAGAGQWPGLQGESEPLRCGGPPRQDVVLFRRHGKRWAPPWRMETPPWRIGGLRQRELDVDAVVGWQAEFLESDFRCVLSMVLEQLAKERHPEAYKRAATWLLRAHDVHSRLLSERAWQDFNEAESHHAELGFRLKRQGRQWRIDAVIAGGAAEKAAIVVGDAMLAIDGVEAGPLDRAAIAARLDKPVGTRVVLRLQTGTLAARDASLEVRSVTVPDVVASKLPDAWVGRRVRGAFRIEISKFAPGGSERLAEALRPRRGAPPRALLLDLRGNGGGIMPVALAMLGRLLGPADVTDVTTRDGSATVPSDVGGDAGADARKRPAIVALIDAGCASACELMTAALRRHARALVVGARSYGKATLQDAIPLRHGPGRVALTIGRFDARDGVQIQALGVEPDVVLAGVRAAGPREEDQAFVLRFASKQPTRMPATRLAALQRCVDTTTVEEAGADAALVAAARWLRCHAETP